MAASSSQQQMIVDAFNSQVYIQDRMDVQHTPLYDTIGFYPGTGGTPDTISQNTATWFTNVGPAAVFLAGLKTYAQTNMSQSQKLPAPEAFSVYGLRLRIKENILRQDLDNILDSFALEFYLGQKCYQRAPLWYFAAGGGIWAAADIPAVAVAKSAAVPQAVYTNGVPDRNAMHKLILNIVIENQMTFYAQLVGTPYTLQVAAALFGTGAILQLLLDGLYARGVQ
jgi:hypothetical protein